MRIGATQNWVSGVLPLLLLLAVGCTRGKNNAPKNMFGPSAPGQAQPGGGNGGSAAQPGAQGSNTGPASKGSGGATGASGSGAGGSGPVPDTLDDGGPLPQSQGSADGGLPRTMMPIDPPVADDCITDVTAGDHSFTCMGLTFLVLVDDTCTKFACGLIFDIHGATMSGAQMRDNTLLYKIAPSKGYIVVNPSATASNTGGTWDLTNDPPKVADFFDRMIKAFHIDPDRIHVDGFSQGSAMTFWFLCNRNSVLASAAPVSGATDVSCMTDSWKPRVSIFYENGTKDQASTIDSSRMMVQSIETQLMLKGGDKIAGDGMYTRTHWTGDGGMEFDYLEHDYGGQPVLDGHCIPGGVDVSGMGTNNFGLNATTCTTGTITINWGELALQWFIDHPRHH